jgi:hypothetical protein
MSPLSAKYILDLCYLELQRGRVEAAREEFAWVRDNMDTEYIRYFFIHHEKEDTSAYVNPGNAWMAERREAYARVVKELLTPE